MKQRLDHRTHGWLCGAYLRLSKEDIDKHQLTSSNLEQLASESIVNQKKLVEEHLRREGIPLFDYYIDDGITGTSAKDRAQFQRLLADIEAGRINCVVVKDASRLGRNYIDTGMFMEYLVPKYQIRFISLMSPAIDSYKDPQRMQSIELPITNLFNEEHSKATSQKVREVFDMKRRQGAYIGSFPVHGYCKDPHNKARLVVDEQAADDIRLIFDLFTNKGMSKSEIARCLNDMGTPSPSAYKRMKGMDFHPQTAGSGRAALWNPRYIGTVLCNRMYIGDMVQGKQRTVSYKVRETIQTHPDEWYVVCGTHEPIIDRALWERTQQRLAGQAAKSAQYHGHANTHLYAGLLRCADCHKAMRRTTQKRSYGKRTYTSYKCRTYTDRSRTACTPHKLKGEELDAAVLAAIQQECRMVSWEQVAQSSAPDGQEGTNAVLTAVQKRISRAQTLRDRLHETYLLGDIEREDFLRLRKQYDDELHTLLARQEQLRRQQPPAADNLGIEHLQMVQQLDRELLEAFVDTIYVEEGGGVCIVFRHEDPH